MLTKITLLVTSRRTPQRAALLLITLSTPGVARACEPIVPLTQLIGGSGIAGPMLLERSIAWLLVAVTIKSVAFALFEHRLLWSQALLFMLIGNVLSTVPGLLAAMFAGALQLLALPVIFALGIVAEHRISRLPGHEKRYRPPRRGIAFAFTVTFIFSVFLFYMAGTALDDRRFASYWIFKLLFSTLAVTLGMAISTVLEECVIARVARKVHGEERSYFTPVLRANYITLALVLLVTAVHILPDRFASPHFIASWWQVISGFLGIA